jgi:hypothetical protein
MALQLPHLFRLLSACCLSLVSIHLFKLPPETCHHNSLKGKLKIILSKIFWISQCTLYPLRFFQVYTSFYFFVLNIFHMLPNILLIFFAYFKPKNNDDPVHDKNYLWPEKLNRYLLDPDSALTKYFLCYNCHPEY